MLSQKKIGRFEVTAVMGQGAMGTVYKAADPVIERVVAIKTINLDLSKEERAEFEERFYREAKSAGRLSHPNIVTIYDVGETDEAAYIAMEFLEGESLRDVLDSGVVLPVERICSIVAQVADALNYAHENGVVHRDVKPANIMILRNHDVKIMDFGVALIPTGSRTQAGTVLGSPKYMAPEQLAGKVTDGRADIFSLGVVLYEMLTGSVPFNGDNLSAIMFKILNEEPALPNALNARVPPQFDRIIAKALAKRPEDRYQTARELAEDLRNFSAPVAGSARPSAAAAKPAQKLSAGAVSRGAASAADPLDVKTEILMPRASHKTPTAGKKPAPAAKSGRKLSYLAIPALAVAALAIIFIMRQPQESGAQGPSAEKPKVQTTAGQPVPPAKPAVEASRSAATPATADAKSATPAAPATVSLAITPWGEVLVDGKMVGISPPLTNLQLQPGTHRIEIRNGTFDSHHVKVNVDAGQSLKIKHKFK